MYTQKKHSTKVVNALIGLLLPILGLYLNNEVFFHVMGDYTHVMYYVIATATGIILNLPQLKNPYLLLVMFFLKSICYSYVLYFLIVFTPYIPLALILTAAMGLGFLLLAPILLAIVFTQSILQDLALIRDHFHKHKITIIAVCLFCTGIMILPAGITCSFLMDKKAINTALKYVYETEYNTSEMVDIHPIALKRTINNLQNHSGSSRLGLFPNNTPFISGYYNKIVLNSATISNRKIQLLSDVFLGKKDTASDTEEENAKLSRPFNRTSTVQIHDYQVETAYHSDRGYYSSWVHLEIENTGNSFEQFETQFSIPNGCYISDYYLYVGTKKKMGMITDKSAANWIYRQIVNRRQDPGILTYVTSNTVNFRVFPFTSHETRQTGIQFVHVEPITLNIDGQSIRLIADTLLENIVQIDDTTHYIPGNMKAHLPKVKRSPVFHFIIDYSEGTRDETHTYMDTMYQFIDHHHIDPSTVSVTLANYNLYPYSYARESRLHPDLIDQNGGFYLDRAIKSIHYDNYMNPSDSYPVIIAITKDMEYAVLQDDYENYDYTFPDSEYVYCIEVNPLNENTGTTDFESMKRYSLLTGTETERTFDQIISDQKYVLIYPNETSPQAYLPANDEGSIIANHSLKEDDIAMSENPWTNGVILQSMNRQINLRIGDRNLQSLKVLQASIRTHIMSPLSAYIVLETEAQEEALLIKQEKILSTGNVYLSDPQDDLTDMSEPSLWVLIILPIILAGYRYKRHNNH